MPRSLSPTMVSLLAVLLVILPFPSRNRNDYNGSLVTAFSSSCSTSISASKASNTLVFHRPLYAKQPTDREDDDDDDEPPDVDIRNFPYYPNAQEGTSSTTTTSPAGSALPSEFGWYRGRSSPSIRKAMGTSNKSTANVYVCTHCGGESAVWRGKCPTCQQWNTFQEFAVPRDVSNFHQEVGGAAHNLLSRSSNTKVGQKQPTGMASSNSNMSSSWVNGISSYSNNRPVSLASIDLTNSITSKRLLIPNDDELNQVLGGGGGLVKGSLLLLGGDPGVGKSTLALQMAASVATLSTPLPPKPGIGMGPAMATNRSSSTSSALVGPVWYVSGEETLEQIATRAQRLNRELPSQLYLWSETNLNVLADQVVQAWMMQSNHERNNGRNANYEDEDDTSTPSIVTPSLLVIDSIQTMVCEAGGASSAGGIVQVRECMALLLRLAKTTNIPIVAIGHVTKAGDVSGPRMVEHMVDAVLYLEHHYHHHSVMSNSGRNNYRWLRAQKNRFGSCQTVGLYDFKDGILVPLPEGMSDVVSPPSEDLEGCAMGIVLEGTHRAMVVEVQALVTTAEASYGKKTCEGIPMSRLSLLLGILQKHCTLRISGTGGGGRNGGISRDIYINVVGSGSKSQQTVAAPSLDLAVAVALTSSHVRIPVRGDTVFSAQVGLLGELRPVPSLEARLLQAQRMGFSRVIVAKGSLKGGESTLAGKKKTNSGEPIMKRYYGLDVYECSNVQDALDLALVAKVPTRNVIRQTAKPSKPLASSSPSSPRPQSVTSSTIDELYLDEFNDVILDDEEEDDDDSVFV